MRIISGTARGRKLLAPPGKMKDIRPTSDRARESLFNILGSTVQDGHILDLFAGTGALGLEAFSRGAARVVLVDFQHTALQLIKKNCAIVAKEKSGKITILRHDLRKGLPPVFNDEKWSPFDLIFLDPPYSMGLSLKMLEWLGNSRIIHDGTTVVAEERSSEQLPELVGNLTLFDQRKYGDTGFWLYSPEKSAN